jgi:hypothetical protein
MNETTLQRWLDGELTREEGQAFLADLSAEERREAEALAALCGEAAHLPRPAPSPDFAARVMVRVRSRPAPRRSIWTWLRAPRLSPLGALAGAAAAAGLAFALATARAPAPATPGTVAIADADAARPGIVRTRLVLRAPEARAVAVAADFNGWDPAASRMRRGEGGVWILDVPLQPGRRYQYMFVVDGRFVTDPNAPASVEDGFGGRNAVLEL